jgi:hypothetical protein
MNNFGLILRNIVFFLFVVPFLLSFAIEHGTAWVAYTSVVALVLGQTGLMRKQARVLKQLAANPGLHKMRGATD